MRIPALDGLKRFLDADLITNQTHQHQQQAAEHIDVNEADDDD